MCRTKKTQFPTPNDGHPAPIPPYTLIYFGPFLPVKHPRKSCLSPENFVGLNHHREDLAVSQVFAASLCALLSVLKCSHPNLAMGHLFIFGKHIESHELQRRIFPSLSRQQIHGMVMPGILLERSRASSRVEFPPDMSLAKTGSCFRALHHCL